MNSEIYRTSWATLYMIFSEQMNQKKIDIMDKVLNNLIERDEVNYSTAWALVRICFVALSDVESFDLMQNVFESVVQDEIDIELIRKEVGKVCELIK